MKKYLKTFSVLTLALVVANGTFVFGDANADNSGLQKTVHNAYPSDLYYNGKQLDNAYTYQNTCYVPLRTLSQEMGYTVTYENYLPQGESIEAYRVYGKFTFSKGKDIIVIYGTNNGFDVYENGKIKENNLTMINITTVQRDMNSNIEKGYLKSSEYDLNTYLKTNTTYIGIRGISELFGVDVNYDKQTGNVYLKDNK